jgi:hypothetical protein
MPFDPYAADLARAAKRPPQSDAPLASDALLAVPAEARQVLWDGLTEAVAATLDARERLPPGGQNEPPPFTVQHAGKPQFNPLHLRQQTLEGWHRLAGIELRLAAQALEALLQANAEVYSTLLAEQCGRVGQLYSELARRAGGWVALSILRWELRLLRYRASTVLAPLIYK